MIISIYGISRSGKDTLIKKITNCCDAYHLEGSKTLNIISNKKYNLMFKELSQNKQDEIRKDFAKYAKTKENDYEFVIVDGHYSFPHENGYKKVFTEEDLSLYDSFFYLKRSSEEIKRNYNAGDKKDYNSVLTSSEKIDEWIGYEIENMRVEVENIMKDFIIINSDEFAVECVINHKKTSFNIAMEIVKDIQKKNKNKKIILSDLDKTISENDITNNLIDKLRLNLDYTKVIFDNNIYTEYQFYRFHTWLKSSIMYDEKIKTLVNDVIINNDLSNDIKKCKSDYFVIGITTGLDKAWNEINYKFMLFDSIYGNYNNIPMTPFIKKLVCRLLVQKYEVIAIGDSIIDLEMLKESCKGYLVSWNKIDSRIENMYIEGKIGKDMYQPIYSKCKYNWTLKTEKIC